MDSFCGSDLWDAQKTWNSTSPDFTPCFHETVLVWVPCAFLWIASPYEIYKIRTAVVKGNRIPWTLVSLLRVILVLVLAVVSSLELINALVNLSDQNPVDYYTPFIKLITFAYASMLITLNRKKAISASGTLFLFWLLLSVGSIITYRSVLTHLLDPNSFTWMLSPLIFTLKVIGIPLIFAEFVLSCFSDSLPFAYTTPGQNITNPNPEWNASFLSHLTFWWFNPLILLGYKKPLQMEDMYDLAHQNSAGVSHERFCQNWSYEKHPEIIWPLFKTYWRGIIGSGALKLVASLLTFVNPTVLDYFLTWMGGKGPYWQGYFFAAVMFSSSILESMLSNQYEYWLARIAMNMRTAVTNTLHRKALRLSPLARSEYTTGQIVNLMSVDTQRIIDYLSFANYMWISPLQIGIALYLLWAQLGIATLAGMAVMLLLIPFNGYITAKWRTTQGRLMKEKDKRSKLMNEVLNGIKVLKMYGWESSFNDQIKAIRKKEMDELKIQTYYMSSVTFSIGCAPIFVALFSFLTFTLIDEKNVLDASKAFVSLSLFNIVRIPLTMIPMLVTFGAMFIVAKNRLNAFLKSEETDNSEIGHEPDSANALTITKGSFSWTKGEDDITLRDINIKAKKGKLIAVVGTVGSGKSSLMSALLGDMNKLQGNVNINGTLAYVPQQAWIQNTTVRQNITFTNKFYESKYQNILEACALMPDLKILAAGDMTEIGEKGINLSGGQKQRVSLARAVYADCETYLLDDPLSAVDSHVGKHLFDQVIGPKGILQGKTRILVTHSIALLPQVDEIIVMKDCQVSEQGTYQELLDRKGAFADFLVEYLAEAGDDEDDTALEEIKALVRPELDRRMSRKSDASSDKISQDGSLRKRLASVSSRKGILERQQSRISSSPEKRPSTPQKPPLGKLIEAESAQAGSVKWNVYMDYIRYIGNISCIVILITNIIANGFNVGSSLWLSAWSSDASYPERAGDIPLRNKRLGVYAALGLSEAGFLFVCNLIVFLGTLKASAILHNLMIDHILRAPMSFFDTTPLGRIMNRFTKDIDNCDIAIRMNIRQFLSSFFKSITTFFIISLQTPYFLIPIVPLGVCYYFIQRYYIMSSRQLRRLESNSRSPIYSHFGETVSGTTSIKAFGAVDAFNQECERKIDVNNGTYILSLAAARWLAVRLEFLGNIIVLLAALFAVWSRGDSDPSSAGLSLSYALTATMTLNMLVKASADLENSLVAVERCLEYTKTPTEAPSHNEATKPKKSWPENGVVRFDNYSARYRDGLDLVLRKVNFEVASKQKVGIVGRTGAGKSSLTVALFRIVEPAGGTIIIDGVDVARLGLQELRSKLTIIPQDPVLFTGSLRLNLDPFDLYSDEELWASLQLAHLKQFVETLDAGLEHKITEGGDNLSVGQRQLVCLARALLRKSKILILDEATAAVDLETDDLIQKTIRNEFTDCTIMTIAHRLNTILDYDKVLVLDEGKVAEFDTPKALLDNPSSIFHSMAKDAGLLGASGHNGVHSEINPEK